MDKAKIDIKESVTLGVKNDDWRNALLGTKGYFSNTLNFNNYVIGTLDGLTKTKFMTSQEVLPFDTSKDEWFSYFIPESLVRFIEEAKPKKLRPFKDIDEFANETDCCEVGNDGLFIRSKKAKQEGFMIYSGYIESNGLIIIHLGAWTFSLNELFENWEYKYGYDSEWLPFGIEE